MKRKEYTFKCKKCKGTHFEILSFEVSKLTGDKVMARAGEKINNFHISLNHLEEMEIIHGLKLPGLNHEKARISLFCSNCEHLLEFSLYSSNSVGTTFNKFT